jgi:hypothetical protein
MDPIALRPRKATEIIDAAVEVYRRTPIPFLVVAAIIRVPWLIVQILVLAPIQDDPSAAIVPTLLIAFGTGLTTFIMAGWVVQIASEVYLGHHTDAFASFRKITSRIPAVFVASVMQSIAVTFGFMLFLFPAVWISAVLFAVIPVVVLERLGPFKAFDRSGDLSKGVKGHILSALGLIVLIWVVLKIGGAILAQLLPTPELQLTVAALIDILLYPVFGIASTLIYYDIRIRKEGFDIEMMAKQATPASAVSA